MKRKPVQRGYYLSRQAYNPSEPCECAVEIAYSTDGSEPFENAGPDQLVRRFTNEDTTFRYPLAAVRAAIEIRDAWQAECRSSSYLDTAQTVIRLTLTTGRGMCAPELFSDDASEDAAEAIKWAEGRYNGRPPREEPKADPEAEVQWKAKLSKVRRDFAEAEEAGYLEWVCESDYEHYDDSFIDADDTIHEEQREEEREELWRTIEREGVYFYGVTSPEFNKEHVCGCGGIIGADDGMEYELKSEALEWLAEKLDKVYEAEAETMAGRATYAGPAQP